MPGSPGRPVGAPRQILEAFRSSVCLNAPKIMGVGGAGPGHGSQTERPSAMARVQSRGASRSGGVDPASLSSLTHPGGPAAEHPRSLKHVAFPKAHSTIFIHPVRAADPMDRTRVSHPHRTTRNLLDLRGGGLESLPYWPLKKARRCIVWKGRAQHDVPKPGRHLGFPSRRPLI